MFDSPRSVAHGQSLEYDVCVAGAGAAGITLALELEGSGLDVCLLEAGGFDEPALDDAHPYAGESIGEPYNLLASRLRYFGGTTNHWGGWCMPLDPIDFRPRSFVPLSGWPFGRSELEPYYARAARICEIDPPVFELEKLPGGDGTVEELLGRHDPDFTVKLLRYSPPTRFGPRYRSRIEKSERVRCFLDSTVTEIEEASGRVSRFSVRSGDKTFFVKARLYVIALGAVENARVLLCSDRSNGVGIGNGSDFVGRCFSDHIGSKFIGQALLPDRAPYVQFHNLGELTVTPLLSFRDEFLEAHDLVNFGIVLDKHWAVDDPIAAEHFNDPRLYPEWRDRKPGRFGVSVRIETTPNRDSRITLLGARDSNGMRRTRLDWRVNSLELDAVEYIEGFLGKKLGSSGTGRFRPASTWRSRSRKEGLGYESHQMGTTRMSTDPGSGVTDPDCRVHSIENLYVSGGSVFPTFGFTNPTLTIVALAIRLADHLKRKTA